MLGTLRCRRILPKFDYWDNCSTRGLELVVVSVLDVCGYMASAGCTSAPSCACLIVGEIFFQSTQLSGLC